MIGLALAPLSLGGSTTASPFSAYPALKAAYAAGRGVIAVIGDSRTCRIGGATANYTLTPSKTIIADLNTAGITAIDGFQFGAHNNAINNPFAYDARLTSPDTSQWLINGYRLISGLTVGAQLSIAPEFSHNKVRHGLIRLGGASTFTITRNGTLLATIDQNAGSPSFAATTYNVTAGSQLTVIDYTVYAGFSAGIYPFPFFQYWDSTVKHVQVCQMGEAGFTVGDWVASAASTSILYAATTLAANLYIIELGANDARTGVSNATYETNLTTLVDAFLATGANVVLAITPPAGGASASSNIPAGYITAINNVTAARSLAAPIDLNTPFSPFSAGNYDADGLHETTAMAASVGHIISARLA